MQTNHFGFLLKSIFQILEYAECIGWRCKFMVWSKDKKV